MLKTSQKYLSVVFCTAITTCLATQWAKAQSLPPVETKKPNSTYQPAFEGQTRIAGIKTKQAYTATVLNSQLTQPFALRCLPDGRFLITEKGGTMKILKTTGMVDKNISGLPAVVPGGQGGLLDVNFDSSFAKNRTLFWCYSEQATDGFVLAVATGVLSADDSKLQQVKVIYRAFPAYNGYLQFGSRIEFDKEGNLFVSTGEHSADEIRVKAQDLGAAIGKSNPHYPPGKTRTRRAIRHN